MWQAVLDEIRQDGTLWLLGGAALVILLNRRAAPEHRRRIVWVLYATTIHLLLVPVAALVRTLESSLYTGVRLGALITAVMAAVGMGTLLLFGFLLPRIGLRTPRILLDVVVGLGSIIGALVVASRVGLDVTGLVATSAILTAVVALSLQDTLGNLVGGLALQLDRSIAPGDWIKFGDVAGRVTEVRWRYTAIETRNWETLIVPNSALAKGNVLVLGRRTGQPEQWRRWVYFNVDFRHTPSEVMRVVEDAIRSAPIQHVAHTPAPNCILMDLGESWNRYAVRYWLTDLVLDDPTDSQIRTRVFMALRRVGIQLSMPAHAVFLTEESAERKSAKRSQELERRLEALRQVDIFSSLSEEERSTLTDSMHYTPFAAGEVLTQQGAEAHWLYMIIDGQVSVRVAVADGGEREVAQLSSGQFFGEAALLTGERRSATIVALTDVRCYRLGKKAFETIMRNRPNIANDVAEVLARRKTELEEVVEQLHTAAHDRRLLKVKSDLAGRIRRALGLEDGG